MSKICYRNKVDSGMIIGMQLILISKSSELQDKKQTHESPTDQSS